MKELIIVKEIKELIPPLAKEEFNLLKQSILNEGVRDPIIVWGKDIVVDGHNRYNICKNHNIKFKTIEKDFTDLDEVKIFIIENQLGRRNLTDEQRTYYIGRLYNENKKQGFKGNQYTKSGSGQNVHKLSEKLAIEKNIDEKTVRRAAIYSNSIDSIKKIDSNVADGILSGKVRSTKKQINEFITQGKEKQKQIIEDIKEGKDFDTVCKRIKQEEKDIKNKEYQKKEAEAKDISNIVINNIENRYKLYNCDLLDAPIDDNSLDVVVTDPPYPYEFIDCWKSLAQFATKKLKDGGVLIAMSGQSYLPEVYKNMTIEGLNYYWTCAIQMTVSPNLYQKRLQTKWKPLLFYVKGEYKRTHLKSDVFNPIYSDTVEGQKFHKWGQGLDLMKDIIERFTYADELVCDPFAGGNTTILAGLELKRRMIGIEIDKQVYDISKKRLEGYFHVAK